MAFVKLYKVVQDSPWGYQSANQLADNAAEMRTQMGIEHGTKDPNAVLQVGQVGSFPKPIDYDALGHHNIVEIPRAVAQTLVFSAFAGFGSFSNGLAWAGPGIKACYWISTGVYFLPVVGLSSFWGKVTALTGSGVTPLEPQVRSLDPSATNGLGACLKVSLFELNAGAFVPADQTFTVALYGRP